MNTSFLTWLLETWLPENQSLAWTLLAFTCIFFEMSSPGLFFFFSFFCGALCAAAVALYTDVIALQVIALLIGTLISFFALTTWTRRYANKITPHSRTNSDALKGKSGIVTRAIERESMGQVKIGGELWAARSVDGNYIDLDREIQVLDVRGAHVVVKKRD